jgi:GTP-binding protein
MSERRSDVRNIAIIAHVDHGKTTLVDAMLRQSGVFRANETLVDRVMDSNALERERGITILAKNTSVVWEGVRINIVDTPGHADFGGEVERTLAMVDGVLLLVDASEGPLPQTRFVLGKALEAGLEPVVVLNKIDRADARPAEVLDEIYGLFIDLGANEEQLDFPIIFTIAKAGTASRELGTPGTDLRPLFDVILSKLPGPKHVPDAPVQFQANNLAYDDYVGRIAIGRVHAGALLAGGQYTLCRTEGSQLPCKITRLYGWHGLKRVEIARADSGDIVAIAGIEEINIGDTVADKEAPTALKPIRVDEPTIAMLFGANTSPWAGRSGNKVTSRQVRDRLFQETLRNVSIRVEETEATDTFRVVGRGELQLAVLIETMRREGFELQVSKPTVIVRGRDGVVEEPVELLVVDSPEDYVGVVTQLLGVRRGIMAKIDHTGGGRVRMEFRVPSRGLIGFRSHFLTETRGTATMNTLFDGWAPWHGADPRPHERRDGLRPRRHGHALRPVPPAGPRRALHAVRGRRLRGHGRRRVLARRRPRGERLPREEAHEHARLGPRRGRAARSPSRDGPRGRALLDRRRRARRGHARHGPHPQARAPERVPPARHAVEPPIGPPAASRGPVTVAHARRFTTVDVFTRIPLRGNPVAVVLDADGLDDAAMQHIAAWTNLSETTFVLPPTLAGASYRLRIFTPRSELKFAGHPTIGSAHAVLAAGLATPVGGTLHQECRAGLLPIRVDGERLMVRVPDPDVRPEAVADAQALGDMVGAPIVGVPRAVDCGPVWLVAEVTDEAALRAATPDLTAVERLSHAHGLTGGVSLFARSTTGRRRSSSARSRPRPGSPRIPSAAAATRRWPPISSSSDARRPATRPARDASSAATGASTSKSARAGGRSRSAALRSRSSKAGSSSRPDGASVSAQQLEHDQPLADDRHRKREGPPRDEARPCTSPDGRCAPEEELRAEGGPRVRLAGRHRNEDQRREHDEVLDEVRVARRARPDPRPAPRTADPGCPVPIRGHRRRSEPDHAQVGHDQAENGRPGEHHELRRHAAACSAGRPRLPRAVRGGPASALAPDPEPVNHPAPHGGTESDEHRLAPGRGEPRGPREAERAQGRDRVADRALGLGQVDHRGRPREAARRARRAHLHPRRRQHPARPEQEPRLLARGPTENIRRIGEVAKLFTDAGVVAITAFISPYRPTATRCARS